MFLPDGIGLASVNANKLTIHNYIKFDYKLLFKESKILLIFNKN